MPSGIDGRRKTAWQAICHHQSFLHQDAPLHSCSARVGTWKCAGM
ncbi:hypothetical protein SNOG_06556 [Parastagonospora nodorum SN15]|uniref:Uncharacterized protein n=1 Tax=Phaeosphaeria nodorum (strain SN15 / ATCC MYA-4574 / FGSC 10173) TaxID=321614 RepID=Q0UNV8_PHANO|nr:hypothetical protein SNOG_06556 [Parastagonospora nodorum SN15]EAT86387.1 hypothetical protein SNOG_06556 [Parastagonospora nodorum SN15]